MNLLFLHGYTQSGPNFSAKTKAVQKSLLKAFGASTTLHFPTAPHRLLLTDIPGTPTTEEPSDAFAWWRRSDTTGEYVGISDTLQFLSQYLDTHGPFTGVIGFSQGAALAGILASILERGDRPEGFTTGHGEMKFAVCYSGFRAPERYEGWYEPRIRTKVLNVIGSLDTVVDEERTMAFVRACEKGEERLVFHPGGHYLPATKSMVGVLVGFIRSCEEVKEEEEEIDVASVL
ncbi:serine hydrolase FSH [Trichophaea hybrida]|nr:serine hydrolase FSH [Trichophaea hybrida]